MVPLTCPVFPCTCLGLELISVSQRRSHLPKHRPHTHTFVRQRDACQAHLREYVREVRRNRQGGDNERHRNGLPKEDKAMLDMKQGARGHETRHGTEIVQKFESLRILSSRSGTAVVADCTMC